MENDDREIRSPIVHIQTYKKGIMYFPIVSILYRLYYINSIYMIITGTVRVLEIW